MWIHFAVGGVSVGKTVGFVAYKGGVGKTTLALSAVERALSEGFRAVILDLDEKGVAALRVGLRSEFAPEAPEIRVERVVAGPSARERVRALIDEGYDLVVCDLPGTYTYEANRFVSELDFVVSPVSNTPDDLLSAGQFAWAAEQMGWKATFVMNNLPLGRGRRERARAEIASFSDKVPVWSGGITRLVGFWDAGERGLCVCEAQPTGRAAREIDCWWKWLRGQLEL